MKLFFMFGFLFVCMVGLAQAQASAEVTIINDGPAGTFDVNTNSWGTSAEVWLITHWADPNKPPTASGPYEVFPAGADQPFNDHPIPRGAVSITATLDVWDQGGTPPHKADGDVMFLQ